jgi:hypothetical protein
MFAFCKISVTESDSENVSNELKDALGATQQLWRHLNVPFEDNRAV